MPCDTVQMTEVDVSRYQRHILEAAIKDLGFTIAQNGVIRAGYIIGRLEGTKITGYGDELTQLTRVLPKAYSRRLVLHNAKRAGWKVRERAGRIQLFK